MRNLLFSLRTRILLLFGVASAIVIVVMAYHAAAVRQMRLKLVNDQLQHTAKVIAEQHDRVIEDAQKVVESLVDAQTTRKTIVPEDCQRLLAQRLRDEPRIANIVVALPDGSVVCSAIPSARPIDIAARNNFHLALASPGVVIGEASASPITGRRMLPFTTAVRDASGRMLGEIGVSLDLSRLATEVGNAKYAGGATLGLIDAKGRVLARNTDAEGWVGMNASGTSFFKAVMARGGEGTFEETGFDGMRRVYGLTRFAETAAGPISLWLGVDKKAVTAEIERDFVWTVLTLAGLLLAIFAAMFAGGERLLQRLVSLLRAAARRLGHGDLSARTGLADVRNKLRRLAQPFDDTARWLETKDQHVVLVNRAAKALSAWNQALLTPRDETSVISSMCRALVEEGGYRAAWVGFAMFDKEKTVEPVAWWGLDPKVVASMRITWADTPRGRSAAGTAIRCGTVVVVDDNPINPGTAPWRKDAPPYQYNAAMSFPLKVNDEVIGALTISAAESESLGEEEAVLLIEVAAALSSGIAAARARAAHGHPQASLQISDGRFRAADKANLDAVFVLKSVRDAAGNLVDFEVTDMNMRARELCLAKGDVIGKTLFQLLPMYRYRPAGFFHKFAQVLATKTPLKEVFAFGAPGAERKWFRHHVMAVDDGVIVSLRGITAWKTAGDKMGERGERLQLAMAGAHMGAWSTQLESDTYSVSEDIGPILGLPRGACPRNTEALLQAVHPDDREALANAIKRNREAIQPARNEFRVMRPDGTVRWLEAGSYVICNEAGKPVRNVGALADITQRKLDIVALQRANRAFKTLLASNEVLSHERHESWLLHEACRVIVREGGYRMAWVAYPQSNQERSLVPKAWAGVKESYLAAMNRTWADTEQGQMPISRALRSGNAEIARDLRDRPAFSAVRKLVAGPGYASNLALPLRNGKTVFGAISIFAEDADAFDDAEVRLLKELANDVAYAICALRMRAERDRILHARARHEAIPR